ncbi:MAG: hypothetical protein SNJ52_02380, partial [Verrucomicrobiia bacterium]
MTGRHSRQQIRIALLLAAWSLLATATTASADPVASSYTLEWPLPPARAVPSWIGDVQETGDGIGSSLLIPVRVPVPRHDLLVTLFFHDQEGGFLRVVWQGTNAQTTLAVNIKEEVGTFHQRTLVIESTTLGESGVLVIDR